MLIKKICLISLALLLTLATVFAQVNPNKVWVEGYYRSSGTYVNGHYRTAPNRTVNDNYSTVGNLNPHTGKRGWLPRDGHANPYETQSKTSTTGQDSREREITVPTTSYPARSTTPVTSAIGSNPYLKPSSYLGTSTGSIDVSDLSKLPLRYVNTTRLNVRLGPGTDAVAFLQAQRSSAVRLIHRDNAPWVKVVVNDGSSYAIGYVHENYLSSEKLTAPPATSEATYTVDKFLTYIDRGSYGIAYGLSDNPNWKSLDWFSSAIAYGAVVGIDVKEVRLESSEGAEALVYARYYAEDPTNKTGTYEQRFYLDGSSGDWRIRKTKLISFEEDLDYRPSSDPSVLPAAKARVRAYQKAVLTNDADAIEGYLAPYLDRFFSFGPQPKSYVLAEHRKYLQRWETIFIAPEPSSWVARKVPGGVEVSTTINLGLRRRSDGVRKGFRIRRIIVLDENDLIIHLDEVILERS
jgi:uncharacterized protein YgiM (DUF1202 family)